MSSLFWCSVLFGIVIAVLLSYLVFVNYSLLSTPPEPSQLCQSIWTEQQIRTRYRELETKPHDFTKNLPPKTNRRYLVIGGSGLVGGWIVQHLLDRGEAAQAIRICDIRPPTRGSISHAQTDFVQTDITDATSVHDAFQKPWPGQLAKQPLTVFHTAAFIHPGDRAADMAGRYMLVNVEGTKNILNATKNAKGSVLIATSSGVVGLRRPRFSLWPWEKYPLNYFQVVDNAEPPMGYDLPIDQAPDCYAYSKLHAEKVVLDADGDGGLRTGTIRPGHAIYGHGSANPMSLAYDYLRRGGTPTWIAHLVTSFVSAQNVSLAHLLFESRLIEGKTIGGNGYAITDPGGPIRYGALYKTLSVLADPAKPVKFPSISPVPMYILCYAIEAYILFRHRYATFLPAAQGDALMLQPGMWQVSVMHLYYNIKKAQEELGYESDLTTLDGLCQQVIEWNQNIKNSA